MLTFLFKNIGIGRLIWSTFFKLQGANFWPCRLTDFEDSLEIFSTGEMCVGESFAVAQVHRFLDLIRGGSCRAAANSLSLSAEI